MALQRVGYETGLLTSILVLISIVTSSYICYGGDLDYNSQEKV